MPRYFTKFFNRDRQFMKDTLNEMKKELKRRGYSLKKHTLGYYEIYDYQGEQIGLIEDYAKYCNTINKMNSF